MQASAHLENGRHLVSGAVAGLARDKARDQLGARVDGRAQLGARFAQRGLPLRLPWSTTPLATRKARHRTTSPDTLMDSLSHLRARKWYISMKDVKGRRGTQAEPGAQRPRDASAR